MSVRVHIILLLLLLNGMDSASQVKSPEDFGYRLENLVYRTDTINILVRSQKGEEQKQKPVILFCQGSLPIPLIIYDTAGTYGTFPFNPDIFTSGYHLVIIGKPNVPVVADASILQPDLTFRDSTGKLYDAFQKRNNLSYYVDRNLRVVDWLSSRKWVDPSNIVVAGHSEGSAIAVSMAAGSPKVSRMIYSGGNPLGRTMTIITRLRKKNPGSDEDVKNQFELWKAVVDDPTSTDYSQGDPFKTVYGFSQDFTGHFRKLSIPVLVSYGTNDQGAVTANDYLQLEMIRLKKNNIAFISYPLLEHNYFKADEKGNPDYNEFNWDRVAGDWKRWLDKK
ncbi:MAG: hypothetical protein ABWZ25_08135 [Chitinophagaceae bacterium]